MDLGITLLLKMGAVLLLLVCVLCGLRRIAAHTASRDRGLIQVVESKTLGQSQTLYLVQVEQRAFLLAASKESVSLLTEVANIVLPAERADQEIPHQWRTGAVLGDWMKAGSRWLSWWRGRFHTDDCGLCGHSRADQA